MLTWHGEKLNKFYITALNAFAVIALAVTDDNILDGNDWGIIATGVVNMLGVLLVSNKDKDMVIRG